MSEFLHMGGYAAFVWSSYGIAFVAMTLMIFMSRSAHKKLVRKLQSRIIRQQQNNEDSL